MTDPKAIAAELKNMLKRDVINVRDRGQRAASIRCRSFSDVEWAKITVHLPHIYQRFFELNRVPRIS